MGGRIKRDAVEINLTEHCNLKCRGCDHASPHLAQKFADLNHVTDDLRMLSAVLELEELKFVGGEPLLHPQLLDFLKIARESGVAKRLTVTTNGVLLDRMDEEFWRLVDRVWVSMYPGVKFKTEPKALLETANRYDVELWIRDMPSFRVTMLNRRNDDVELVRQIYARCKIAHVYSCHTVHEGRYYKCSPGPFIPRRLEIRGMTDNGLDDDGVRLHDNPTLRQDLEDYLNDATPLGACAYCLGTVGNVFPHEQLNKADLAAEIGENSQDVQKMIDWELFNDPKQPHRMLTYTAPPWKITK